MIYQILFKPLPRIILKPIHYRLLKTPLKNVSTFFHLCTGDVGGDLQLLYSRRT